VITPAISVLSAVEGLEIITPAFKPYILPITLVILVGLFFIQRRGTASVGALFGPVMMLWFAVLAATGCPRHRRQHPAVLAAVNPTLWVQFPARQFAARLLRAGRRGALHHRRRGAIRRHGAFRRQTDSIRVAGLCAAGTAHQLLRPGRAAAGRSKRRRESVSTGWRRNGRVYPLVILATVATVIASQAVISGAFSITRQAIQLGYTPRLEVQHTSDQEIGQIYLPALNWLHADLAIIALVLGFGTSSNLAAAYGIAVTGTMLITNLLAIAVAVRLWQWSPLRAVLGALPFIIIDLGFFLANSAKIPDGGWFPLAFGWASSSC
jgi:KUP system potassium uptake protein